MAQNKCSVNALSNAWFVQLNGTIGVGPWSGDARLMAYYIEPWLIGFETCHYISSYSHSGVSEFPA